MKMTVHVRASSDEQAPCGYRFQPRLRGLDWSWYTVANATTSHVADCIDCLVHMPRKAPHRAQAPMPTFARKFRG